MIDGPFMHSSRTTGKGDTVDIKDDSINQAMAVRDGLTILLRYASDLEIFGDRCTALWATSEKHDLSPDSLPEPVVRKLEINGWTWEADNKQAGPCWERYR